MTDTAKAISGRVPSIIYIREPVRDWYFKVSSGFDVNPAGADSNLTCVSIGNIEVLQSLSL